MWGLEVKGGASGLRSSPGRMEMALKGTGRGISRTPGCGSLEIRKGNWNQEGGWTRSLRERSRTPEK